MLATKPELAAELLVHAHERGTRAAFVAGEEVTAGGSYAARSGPRHGVCAGGPRALTTPSPPARTVP